MVSDSAGILKSGVKFYVPSDWAPTGECDIQLTAEEEERLMGSAYQDSVSGLGQNNRNGVQMQKKH